MDDSESGSTNDSYREIGLLLQHAREELRLSQDEASRLLHIRLRYLDAMEQGRLEELPGLPYVRGYIQSYAQFLGLDKEEIIRRFDAVELKTKPDYLFFPQSLVREKSPNGRFVWGGLGVAIMIYMTWALFISAGNRSISVVEPFPRKPNNGITLSALILQDVACLNMQEALYPPCTFWRLPKSRIERPDIKWPLDPMPREKPEKENKADRAEQESESEEE